MTTGKRWFVYLVRAVNGALYCGITDDVWRRYAQHRSGRGARFFRSSPPQALVYVEAWPSKGEALSREHAIKRLSKVAKESLVQGFGPLPAVLAALGLEQSAEVGQQE